MAIMASLVALVGLTVLVDAVVRYRRTVFHAPAALGDEQKLACSRIVDAGLGRAWICRKAIADGECPCLPCENLDREMKGDLAMTARFRR